MDSSGFDIQPDVLDNFLVEAGGGGNIPNPGIDVPFDIKVTARDQYDNTNDSGGNAAIFQANLVIEEELDALVPAVTDQFGSLNILINSASVYRQVSMDETDRAEWDENMALHAWAPFRLSQIMVRELGDSPGKIVNINDAHLTRPSRFAYGVSKAALSAITRSLAGAVGPNVQVNELALGAILPPPDWSDERIQRLTAGIPAQRWGSPADVAEAIIALIRNDYINAETIHIDGGVTGTRK